MTAHTQAGNWGTMENERLDMTKKHFIELADVVMATEPIKLNQKDARASAEHRQWERMRDALAQFCANQNPRFMRDRWLDYIAGTNGKNGGKVKVAA